MGIRTQGQPTDSQCDSIIGIRVQEQPTEYGFPVCETIMGIRVQGQPTDSQCGSIIGVQGQPTDLQESVKKLLTKLLSAGACSLQLLTFWNIFNESETENLIPVYSVKSGKHRNQ
jgi:hypothetical protein